MARESAMKKCGKRRCLLRENRLVDLFLHKAHVVHSGCDILLPEGLFGFGRSPNRRWDPFRKGLSHGVRAKSARHFAAIKRLPENAVGVHARDRFVFSFAAPKYKTFRRRLKVAGHLCDPGGKGELCVGVHWNRESVRRTCPSCYGEALLRGREPLGAGRRFEGGGIKVR